MKLLVIGGHSRNIGKTSLAAGLISALNEFDWTAVKLTQFGHNVCSSDGHACDCAPSDPDHPYAISREEDARGDSDTSRLLRAGAREAYWVRTRVGELDEVIPALRKLLTGRSHVLMESNSILDHLRPDLYLPVLDVEVSDFKASSRSFFARADAFVVRSRPESVSTWEGIDLSILNERPVFPVEPPRYCSDSVVDFARPRLV
jgi:hypothetical protein